MTNHKASRIIVNCPSCGQNQGVPGDRGTLKVKCPHCSHTYLWRPEEHNSTRNKPNPTKQSAVAKPRSIGLLYVIACIAAIYATFWFDKKAGNSTLMVFPFILSLILTYYFAFRAIRLFTRLRVAKAIIILFVLQITLPFLIPYLSNIDISQSSSLKGTVFEGRSAENTSSSEMDDLMEEW